MIRSLLLWWFYSFRKEHLGTMVDRAAFTAIGFSGHVSMVDDSIAKERGFAPLTKFEYWLLKPYIDSERKARQTCFQDACREILGEDL